jgi:hypothetical protein
VRTDWAVAPRTAQDIEKSLTHLDLDFELAYYARRKMLMLPGGKFEAVRSLHGYDGPGSLFTGIPAELLYRDTGTANTAVAGTAAEVVMNLINPFGQSAVIPAGFWLPGSGPGGIGRMAKLVIRGIWTTAAAAGTAIFTTRIGALQSVTATIGGISPTVVPATPAVLAGGMWEQELDIELQSFGTATAAAIIRGIGKHGCTGWASPNTNQLTWTPMTGQSANSNGLSAATIDITANNYISWNQNCTAATITSLQLLQAFVYGMG